MPANLFLSDPPDTIDYVLISNILIAVGIRRRAYRLPKGRTNKISSLWIRIDVGYLGIKSVVELGE